MKYEKSTIIFLKLTGYFKLTKTPLQDRFYYTESWKLLNDIYKGLISFCYFNSMLKH